VDGQKVNFRVEESIRLFFSYRYTPALVVKLLAEHGMTVLTEWMTALGREGVYLVKRNELSAESMAA